MSHVSRVVFLGLFCGFATTVLSQEPPQFCPDVELDESNEVSIAVNPLDPNNIAVAYIALDPGITSELRISTDGGQSFPIITQAKPAIGYENVAQGPDPVLTFGADGYLYWLYLGFHTGGGCDYCFPCGGECPAVPDCLDILVAKVDSYSGRIIGPCFDDKGVAFPCPVTSSHTSDKPWLAADTNPTSPFYGRLYVVWTEGVGYCYFPPPGSFRRWLVIQFSHSDDGGINWSDPQSLSEDAVPDPIRRSDVRIPSHVAVAPLGDVYVAYHFFPNGGVDGQDGRVFFTRSNNGGLTWSPLTLPFQPGQADVTENRPPVLEGTKFWTLGSWQPWVLADPDPLTNVDVYVVANDDPNDIHGDGDDASVFIVRSNDDGQTWSNPICVDHGTGNSFQVFPTATIDPATGSIAVMWYDNRLGRDENMDGFFELDVYFTISTDQGISFRPDLRLNDAPFDPEFSPIPGPIPGMSRIGEYNGVAFAPGPNGRDVLAAWTAHDEVTADLQIKFGSAPNQAHDCPDFDGDGAVGSFDLAMVLGCWDLGCGNIDNTDGLCTTDAADLAKLLGSWGPCPTWVCGGGAGAGQSSGSWPPSAEELVALLGWPDVPTFIDWAELASPDEIAAVQAMVEDLF